MRSLRRRWPKTELVWRQFAQMDLMMERLDVDIALAARISRGEKIAEARNICLGCLSQVKCREWLEGQGGRQGAIFCPNYAFFDACRRDEAGGAAARPGPMARGRED